MVARLTPNTTEVRTVDGECTIKLILELNINLNQGQVNIVSASTENKEKLEDGGKPLIPNFKSEKLSNFAKKVE